MSYAMWFYGNTPSAVRSARLMAVKGCRRFYEARTGGRASWGHQGGGGAGCFRTLVCAQVRHSYEC